MNTQTPDPEPSAKEQVKQRFPKAFAHSWRDCWEIFTPRNSGNEPIGVGKTAALAWKDAMLRARKEKP